MDKTNGQIITAIKKSLAQLTEAVESEAIIYFDAKGRHWLTGIADDFLLKKGVAKDAFMDWLKIGSAHLQNFNYGDIDIGMMKLPDGGAIAFLRHNHEKEGLKQCRLTNKESEVLRHLAKGFSNKQIAADMKISPETVNGHLDKIYEKLGCSNRLVACLVALQNGFLLPKRQTPPGRKIQI